MTAISGMISKSDLEKVIRELESMRYSLYSLSLAAEQLAKQMKKIYEAPAGPQDSSYQT